MVLSSKFIGVFATLLLFSISFTIATDQPSKVDSKDLPICKGRAVQPCSPFKVPRNCHDIRQLCGDSDCLKSGVYYVFPVINGDPLQVYCDMETDGGGWLVFQRRSDGSVDFYRRWADYKNGFGIKGGEFWLGNNHLHEITDPQHGRFEMRVDMLDFDGASRYAKYNQFTVQDETQKFKLILGTYSGTAGDSLRYSRNRYFSTSDKDHDSASTNCAQTKRGAWWYYNCLWSNLNGQYLSGPTATTTSGGVFWYYWKGRNYSLKETEMKLRPYGV